MDKETIQTIQTGLNKHYTNTLIVDGDAGMKTMAALDRVPLLPLHWNAKRKLVGFIQVYALIEGFNGGPIDGFIGPQTSYALDQLKYLITHGDKEPLWRAEDDVNIQTPSVSSDIPLQNYKDLVKYYGEVGTNQTKVNLPHAVRLAWDTKTKINRFTCHERVADSLVRVLNRVVDHYGSNQYVELGLDLWAGCLNVRKMRGGNRYSMHSWGIALDWDSTRNRLRWGKDRANFSKPIYDEWWKIWEDEQWVSLGRETNRDYMHVQRARLK